MGIKYSAPSLPTKPVLGIARLRAERRLELAWRALFWSVYHRMYIVAVDGYTLELNFTSDQSYHAMHCCAVAVLHVP